MSTKNIIPEETLKNKRLKKLMGDNLHKNPQLRQFLGRLQGVRRLELLEWGDLQTERERAAAHSFFWNGVHKAREWFEEGLL